MIGQYTQRLHQGVAPDRSMANFGGGGGGGQAYYANQDKLFGTQADIAQNLYNQYAGLAPGYLQNSLDMTNEAMSGKLADRARGQAGSDASAAMGQALTGAQQHLDRYGSTMNPNALGAQTMNAAMQGAASKANAMTQASQWAEDQKWNRNANAYGQIAGMGNGAMQGMGSAASGYGQMSGQMAANNAANATGYGKFGAGMVAGSKWADGGFIKKPGLHLAQGAYVRGSQSVNKPNGYQQQVLSLPMADWHNQATSGGMTGGPNPLVAIAGGAAPYLIGDAVRGGLKYGKEALTRAYNDYQAQQAEYDAAAQANAGAGYTGAESFGLQGGGANAVDWGAQNAADEVWLNEGFAKGGYINKPGLRLAGGGYAQPISDSYGSDPGRFQMSSDEMAARQVGNTAGNAAVGYGLREGAKGAWNYVTAPSADTSLVSSAAETPGVASAAPVANSGAGITSSALPEAGTAAATDAAATAGTAAATDAAAAAGTAAATDAAAAAGTAAATDAAATAAAAAAAETAAGSAAADSALSYLALLLLKDGGEVPNRGLQRKNFKPGGKVQGPGTETSDDIPAWLSDGEFVLNAEAVKLIGKAKLEKLNQQGLKLRGQKEEVAEGHPGVKDSPAEEKREARGLKAKPVKKAKGGMIKRKGC